VRSDGSPGHPALRTKSIRETINAAFPEVIRIAAARDLVARGEAGASDFLLEPGAEERMRGDPLRRRREREELEPLITRALVGICGVTELEMLFSARNIQQRSRMKEQLEASMDRVDTPEGIWEQAAEIQEALTEQAQRVRGPAPGACSLSGSRRGPPPR
jgi:hypothetical protein